MSLRPWKTNTGVLTNASKHFGSVKPGCVSLLNQRARGVQKTTLEWVILADLALGGVGARLMPQQRRAAIRRRGLVRESRAQSGYTPRMTRQRSAEAPVLGLLYERGLAKPRYQLAIGEDRRMA